MCSLAPPGVDAVGGVLCGPPPHPHKGESRGWDPCPQVTRGRKPAYLKTDLVLANALPPVTGALGRSHLDTLIVVVTYLYLGL